LKALNDPSFLQPGVPPILKKGAEVKIAEDLAPQKIKAAKYLAKIGCGCYDKDKSITEALTATMVDCTEKVRLATIEAVAEAAAGQCCANCGQTCCCNEDILKTLARLAYERDEFGCYEESSQRVREAAVRALEICCPGTGPVEEEMPEQEEKEEDLERAEEGTEEQLERPSDAPPAEPTPLPNADEDGEERKPPQVPDSFTNDANDMNLQTAAPIIDLRPPLPTYDAKPTVRANVEMAPKPVVQLATDWQRSSRPDVDAANPLTGQLAHIDSARGIAHVHFADRRTAPVGSYLAVLRNTRNGKRQVGQLRVFESFPGSVNVQGVDATFQELRTGDEVVQLPKQHGTMARHVSHRTPKPSGAPRKGLPSPRGLGR
jgi:hypothetical protein